jgi:prepilin-type processing-associated H-X9-DG protein
VELLVVIAIISVLVSLLTPSLRSARAAAKSATCKNNLKQLALGILMYAQDNDGAFPSYDYRKTDHSYVHYHRNIWPYLQQGGTYHNWGVMGLKMRRWVYSCPADPEGLFLSYAINGNLDNRKIPGDGYAAERALIMDFAISLDPPCYSGGKTVGSEANILLRLKGRHGGTKVNGPGAPCTYVFSGGKDNIAFLDGHVEARSPESIPPREDTENNGHIFWSRR